MAATEFIFVVDPSLTKAEVENGNKDGSDARMPVAVIEEFVRQSLVSGNSTVLFGVSTFGALTRPEEVSTQRCLLPTSKVALSAVEDLLGNAVSVDTLLKNIGGKRRNLIWVTTGCLSPEAEDGLQLYQQLSEAASMGTRMHIVTATSSEYVDLWKGLFPQAVVHVWKVEDQTSPCQIDFGVDLVWEGPLSLIVNDTNELQTMSHITVSRYRPSSMVRRIEERVPSYWEENDITALLLIDIVPLSTIPIENWSDTVFRVCSRSNNDVLAKWDREHGGDDMSEIAMVLRPIARHIRSHGDMFILYNSPEQNDGEFVLATLQHNDPPLLGPSGHISSINPSTESNGLLDNVPMISGRDFEQLLKAQGTPAPMTQKGLQEMSTRSTLAALDKLIGPRETRHCPDNHWRTIKSRMQLETQFLQLVNESALRHNAKTRRHVAQCSADDLLRASKEKEARRRRERRRKAKEAAEDTEKKLEKRPTQHERSGRRSSSDIAPIPEELPVAPTEAARRTNRPSSPRTPTKDEINKKNLGAACRRVLRKELKSGHPLFKAIFAQLYGVCKALLKGQLGSKYSQVAVEESLLESVASRNCMNVLKQNLEMHDLLQSKPSSPR